MICDVSVIVPTYYSPFIGQALASVLEQTVLPREIIVVDGSPETTRAELVRFQGKVIHIEQAPKGVSAARNTGIEAATSEFVALLDADDFWFHNKLELEIGALQKHSHAGFSFSPVWNYCHSELKNIPSNPYLPKELIAWLGEHELADGAAMGSVYELLLSVNCVATSSVVAHRRALLEVDLFDESFNNGEDYDLWLRLARRFPAVVFSRPTSRYRVHETGLSGSWHARARLFYRYNIRVLERHRAQFPSSLTRDAIAEHYSGFAYYLLCHGELKDARAMAERSLQIQPNFAALRTYFEARFPDGYAWLSRRLRRVRS